MQWRTLGRIYEPEGRHPKLASHGANSLAAHLTGDAYRVFFNRRDASNHSSVGGVDLDIAGRKVVVGHREPFFTHGEEGSYFCDGVSDACCYDADGQRYLLFMGWKNPPDGRWQGNNGRFYNGEP